MDKITDLDKSGIFFVQFSGQSGQIVQKCQKKS